MFRRQIRFILLVNPDFEQVSQAVLLRWINPQQHGTRVVRVGRSPRRHSVREEGPWSKWSLNNRYLESFVSSLVATHHTWLLDRSGNRARGNWDALSVKYKADCRHGLVNSINCLLHSFSILILCWTDNTFDVFDDIKIWLKLILPFSVYFFKCGYRKT